MHLINSKPIFTANRFWNPNINLVITLPRTPIQPFRFWNLLEKWVYFMYALRKMLGNVLLTVYCFIFQNIFWINYIFLKYILKISWMDNTYLMTDYFWTRQIIFGNDMNAIGNHFLYQVRGQIPQFWMCFYSIHVIVEYKLSGFKIIWNQIVV